MPASLHSSLKELLESSRVYGLLVLARAEGAEKLAPAFASWKGNCLPWRPRGLASGASAMEELSLRAKLLWILRRR